ncbi:MAG: hypothetical protein HQL15_05455 [Candidatus Omnitrophica bacterium]|nr:hypothetical protein [Candidatus Omnitrophota bacterium]
MNNRLEQYQDSGENLSVLLIAENNFNSYAVDQEVDCWQCLWQTIKIKGLRVLRSF